MIIFNGCDDEKLYALTCLFDEAFVSFLIYPRATANQKNETKGKKTKKLPHSPIPCPAPLTTIIESSRCPLCLRHRSSSLRPSASLFLHSQTLTPDPPPVPIPFSIYRRTYDGRRTEIYTRNIEKWKKKGKRRRCDWSPATNDGIVVRAIKRYIASAMKNEKKKKKHTHTRKLYRK